MQNVAITIDQNYIQHASVMLRSLEANTQETVNVYCIYQALNKRSLHRIKKQFNGSHINLIFIQFDVSVLPKLPMKDDDHVTTATYFRIWLPNILKDLDQVVFMDTDIVINADVSELFNIDLDGVALAAVPDMGVNDAKKAQLNIPLDKHYFNAGILVINLKYFRDNQLTAKTIQFIKNHPGLCEFWDQDALNATISGNFKLLDFAFNVQTCFYTAPLQNNVLVQKAIASPVIVHFTGGGNCKPWHYHSNHTLKHLYYKYLKTTSFRYFYPAEMPRGKIYRKIRFMLFYR